MNILLSSRPILGILGLGTIEIIFILLILGLPVIGVIIGLYLRNKKKNSTNK